MLTIQFNLPIIVIDGAGGGDPGFDSNLYNRITTYD